MYWLRECTRERVRNYSSFLSKTTGGRFLRRRERSDERTPGSVDDRLLVVFPRTLLLLLRGLGVTYLQGMDKGELSGDAALPLGSESLDVVLSQRNVHFYSLHDIEAKFAQCRGPRRIGAHGSFVNTEYH